MNTVVDVNNPSSIGIRFSVGSYDCSKIADQLVFRIEETENI